MKHKKTILRCGSCCVVEGSEEVKVQKRKTLIEIGNAFYYYDFNEKTNTVRQN